MQLPTASETLTLKNRLINVCAYTLIGLGILNATENKSVVSSAGAA